MKLKLDSPRILNPSASGAPRTGGLTPASVKPAPLPPSPAKPQPRPDIFTPPLPPKPSPASAKERVQASIDQFVSDLEAKEAKVPKNRLNKPEKLGREEFTAKLKQHLAEQGLDKAVSKRELKALIEDGYGAYRHLGGTSQKRLRPT